MTEGSIGQNLDFIHQTDETKSAMPATTQQDRFEKLYCWDFIFWNERENHWNSVFLMTKGSHPILGCLDFNNEQEDAVKVIFSK